jgi:hypothetical protein
MNPIAHRFVLLMALLAPAAAGAQTVAIPAAADTYLRVVKGLS